ncbi:MAG: hypothetical protein ABSH46_06265 [Bryobacteraceae bacterium]
MKSILIVLALASVLAAADKPAADKPRVTREALAGVEKSTDGAIRSWDVTDPVDLLGFTRAVYLPGYGVVFTTEVNLVVTMMTPMSPPLTGQKLVQLKEKKRQRLTFVRNWMRQALIDAGGSLDQVPPGERIVYAMTLFYQYFEDHSGMPNQIVIEAPRQALADFKAGRIDREKLDAAITAWEI